MARQVAFIESVQVDKLFPIRVTLALTTLCSVQCTWLWVFCLGMDILILVSFYPHIHISSSILLPPSETDALFSYHNAYNFCI